MTRISSRIFAIVAALTVAGCSGAPECQTNKVQDTLFSILRSHLDEVMARTDSPILRSMGVALSINELNASIRATSGKTGVKGEQEQLARFIGYMQERSRFTTNVLTEQTVDPNSKTRTCRANIRVFVAIPPEMRSEMPQLSVNNVGEVPGNLDIIYTVQSELSGHGKFYVEAHWVNGGR